MMQRRWIIPMSVVVLTGWWSPFASAIGADEPPQPPPPATAPAGSAGSTGATDPKSPPATPSLDDLLGLPPGERPQAPDAAAEEARRNELKQALSERDLTDAFTAALDKMTVSAELLEARRDTGLGTQRIQQEVLAKLDQLLDMADKMSQSSSSSSGGSSSAARSPGAAQPKPSASGTTAQNPGERSNKPSDSTQELTPPPRQDGDINTIIDETRHEWGNLPQRVRDMMLQGTNGKFSSLYERLTQEYYRRLAEDGS